MAPDAGNDEIILLFGAREYKALCLGRSNARNIRSRQVFSMLEVGESLGFSV
jgi:hypothetical protein